MEENEVKEYIETQNRVLERLGKMNDNTPNFIRSISEILNKR